MKPAINISLVPELDNTPHINSQHLEKVCGEAAKIGYQGVEFFPRRASDFPVSQVKQIIGSFNLKVCALGTGAGKVLYGLTLSSPDMDIRKQAIEYVNELIEVASIFEAPLIIGSMQGSSETGCQRTQTLEWLAKSLNELDEITDKKNVTILLEPINRYESNLINRLDQGVHFLNTLGTKNIKLLADLFHMNIEEKSMVNSLYEASSYIGHIHFVDSNRMYPGLGHMNFKAVFEVLREIQYSGYMSIEAMVTETNDDMKTAMSVFNNMCKLTSNRQLDNQI